MCVICLEENFDNTVTTKCNHTFHKICLKLWLQRKNECPMCRTKLSIIYDAIPTYNDQSVDFIDEWQDFLHPFVIDYKMRRRKYIFCGLLKCIGFYKSDNDIVLLAMLNYNNALPRYALEYQREYDKQMTGSEITIIYAKHNVYDISDNVTI